MNPTLTHLAAQQHTRDVVRAAEQARRNRQVPRRLDLKPVPARKRGRRDPRPFLA